MVAEAAFIIGGFVLFDAVRWQRVGIVALLPWAVIAVTAAIVVARVMGENPEAPGSSVPAIVAILVGVGGWVLTTRWAYRRFPPTARQRAAASSADREFLRTQTPAVGCIVGGAWLFLGGVVLAVLGPEASRGPVGGVVLVIMLIGVVVMPILAVRYVRRRYPPDPQTPEQGLANRVMLLLVLAIVLILVVILISPASAEGSTRPSSIEAEADPVGVLAATRPALPGWGTLRGTTGASRLDRITRLGGPANVAKVTMPQLGESVAEGTIGKWLKQPGDHVDKYEPLLEVITDKVNAEVPSPFAGILKEILVQEGETVPNEAEIAIIDTADEASAPEATAPTTTSAPTAAPEPAHGPAGSDERPAPAAAASAPIAAPAPTAAAPLAPAATLAATGDPDARMTPAVRRLLREHGLSPEQVPGTGGGGRITRDDVLAVVESIRTGGAAPATNGRSTAAPAAPSAAPKASAPAGGAIAFPPGADELLLPMTQMRKGIAAQMTRALAVPHAYVHMEVDASGLVRAREAAKRDYQAREGLSLSYVPFVIKAAVDALKQYPTFNSHWTDAGLLAKRRINMGVAVAVDDGLLVPVVRDVDQLSINGLNHAIADVAARARAGKLRLDDYGGSTFTIDNTGWFGSNLTMPIINVPEVAILTMEAITKRPVVRETPEGDVIAIRPVMNMVLAIDHRANDGAQAAAFLRVIKAALEAVGTDTPVY